MIKKLSLHAVDAVILVLIFAAGLVFYGDLYKGNEKKFSFYQKYFYSAVNIYCLMDPDAREYNSAPGQELDERINLSVISCSDLGKSRKVGEAYFNSWHDTHPILSTLIGYNWRLGDFTWEALWPLVGSLASLTILSFYLILRCFGLPWYAALLIFPATIPYALLEQNFYYLRDFSKVPFILIAFALLGILFRPGNNSKLRVLVLASATGVIAIGVGFRQDAIVLMPVILAAATLTSSPDSKSGILRVSGEIAVVFLAYFGAGSIIGLLKTSQVAQLQGYPHFVVQGFADDFWKAALTKIEGISFMALYSDSLAYAAVDANSPEKVLYFATMDPKYVSSGFDLIAKYAGLSAADVVTRVFRGLSAMSHNYWAVKSLGIWLLLLLALVALGKWRLGFFLMFAILSLMAAGSLQFSPRHSLHLIMLDRAILVIVVGALLAAIWQYATSRLDFGLGLALWSIVAGSSALVSIIIGAHFVQHASLSRVKAQLEALPWFSSQEAYRSRFPNQAEAVLRITVDGSKCSTRKPEATVAVEGQKFVHPLDLQGGGPRSVYFAVYDPAIITAVVEVTPQDCVTARAWGPLGDGTIPPLQFFDPETALKKQTLMRHLGNLWSSFL